MRKVSKHSLPLAAAGALLVIAGSALSLMQHPIIAVPLQLAGAALIAAYVFVRRRELGGGARIVRVYLLASVVAATVGGLTYALIV